MGAPLSSRPSNESRWTLRNLPVSLPQGILTSADSVEKLPAPIFSLNFGVVKSSMEGQSSIVGDSEQPIFYAATFHLR
jgi:hypothetical protein